MIENLLGYTETDPNAKITVVSNKVTWALIHKDEDAYVYADKGAGYFDGYIECQLTFRVTGGTADGTRVCGVWSLANLVDDLIGIDTASGDFLTLGVGGSGTGWAYHLQLIECDAGTQYASATTYNLTVDTDYYITIKRDETVGTFGTLYAYIYSDASRTTLLATLSVALHTSLKSFRYIYALHSMDANDNTLTNSGYVQDFEIIQVGTTPVVTTEATTNITGTTATGNGTITSLGAQAVTQHGHCWATAVDPTTADSKTTNGAGALGSFTSALTGLSPGVTYYCRAYATNSEGTSYGANVSFVANYPSSQKIPGNIAIKGTTLRYVGYDGKEYSLQGA